MSYRPLRLPPLSSYLSVRSLWYRVERENLQIVTLSILIFLSTVALFVFAFAAWGSGVRAQGGEALWWAILHLTDTGNLAGDEGTTGELLGILATFVGITLVGAGLNAVMTNLLFDAINRLRSVGEDIRFEDHILVVGWNSRIHGVVRDLLLADRQRNIVILGDISKEEADRELERRVFAPLRPHTLLHGVRSRVLYREGHPLSRADLERVGVHRCSSLIFLSAGRDLEADVMTLRAYESAQQLIPANRRPAAILEISDISLRFHVFLAAGINPRVDRWVDSRMRRRIECGEQNHLPTPHSASTLPVTLVHGDEVVARTLVQAVVQPLLGRLFDTLLSSRGHDLYLLDPEPARWRALLQEVQKHPASERLMALNAWIEDGYVLGIYGRRQNEQGQDEGAARVEFDPAKWPEKMENCPLVVLGDRQRPLRLKNRPEPWSPAQPPPPPPEPPETLQVLILGYNHRLPLMMEQLEEFAHQCSRLKVQVSIVGHDLDVAAVEAEIRTRAEELSRWNQSSQRHSRLEKVTVTRADFAHWEVLSPILQNGAFDTILLLAEEGSIEKLAGDGRALLGQVMLRSFRHCPSGCWEQLKQTSVVIELTDPRNRSLVDADEGVSDVVVSTDIVAQLIAQIAADPRVEEVYRELLDYGDWEIQLRPLSSYGLTTSHCWKDVFVTAAARGEVAIAYTNHHRSGPRRWMEIGPAWNQPMGDATGIFVIVKP